MPRVRKLHEKRGFALILVFSLAAIILLLSLSLVSLTQIETASSRYDQGMHLARDNAQIHSAQRDGRAELLLDSAELEERRHRR